MQVTCRKVLDQSKSNSVGVLFDAAGRVDILVKNASAIPGDDLRRFDTTRWRAARHHDCRAVTVASASEYFFPKLPYRSF
jgi:NADP-dependent 3-hydroxy acid dehydrogenase YdfG